MWFRVQLFPLPCYKFSSGLSLPVLTSWLTVKNDFLLQMVIAVFFRWQTCYKLSVAVFCDDHISESYNFGRVVTLYIRSETITNNSA